VPRAPSGLIKYHELSAMLLDHSELLGLLCALCHAAGLQRVAWPALCPVPCCRMTVSCLGLLTCRQQGAVQQGAVTPSCRAHRGICKPNTHQLSCSQGHMQAQHSSAVVLTEAYASPTLISCCAHRGICKPPLPSLPPPGIKHRTEAPHMRLHAC